MDKGTSGQQTEEAKSGKSGSGANLDLTFITNEEGRHLSDRFGVLLGGDSRFFDCLVGYFFIFSNLVRALLRSTIALRNLRRIIHTLKSLTTFISTS